MQSYALVWWGETWKYASKLDVMFHPDNSGCVGCALLMLSHSLDVLGGEAECFM